MNFGEYTRGLSYSVLNNEGKLIQHKLYYEEKGDMQGYIFNNQNNTYLE